METFPWITLMTLLPLAGGLILCGLVRSGKRVADTTALAFALAPLAIAVFLWIQFDSGIAEPQFVERHPWIPVLGVEYFVGIDGLSLLMVLLTAVVIPMAIATASMVESRGPVYLGLLLLLEAGLFGTFTAFNFFHWFLFFELSLVPAFFLIKLWGGNFRGEAATQFFVYTMVGSIAMLLGFLGLALATGSFDFFRLGELGSSGQLQTAIGNEMGGSQWGGDLLGWIFFAGIFLGFAVKVPLMPFHTWLPPAYAEAPSTTTMVLTGVMSKMGVYGFLRILVPIFPEAMRVTLIPLLILAVLTIVLSAWAALAQRDIKRILAYSSINHLGYCLLGAFAAVKAVGPDRASDQAAALSGVMLQMFNHGVTAAALFCFVAFLEQRSGGLRGLADFGGLRQRAPVFCGLMGIALFASLGLPGLSSFVGEFLIFRGSFALAGWAAAWSSIGLLLTAIFVLALLQRVFHGRLNDRWTRFNDLSLTERLLVLPAIALIFGIGIYPQPVLAVINATVLRMVGQLSGAGSL